MSNNSGYNDKKNARPTSGQPRQTKGQAQSSAASKRSSSPQQRKASPQPRKSQTQQRKAASNGRKDAPQQRKAPTQKARSASGQQRAAVKQQRGPSAQVRKQAAKGNSASSYTHPLNSRRVENPRQSQLNQPQEASGVLSAALQKGKDSLAQAQQNKKSKPKRSPQERWRKRAIIAGAVLAVYLIGVAVFSHWFVPNTKLGVFDISFKTSSEVQEMLDNALADYSLEVTGDGFSFTASAKDAGLAVDTKATVDAIHQDLSGWKWPITIIPFPHDETKLLTSSSSSGIAIQNLMKAIDTFNASATPPQSATIAYDSSKKRFVVEKDVIGTQLDADAVTDAASVAMAYLQPKLELDESYLLQPAVKADDPSVKAAVNNADKIIQSKISLLFGSVTVGTVDGNVLVDMVALDDKGNATLDQGKLKTWVTDFASRTNTAGSTRNYVRDDGKEVSVTGGVYGWEIDVNATCKEITDAAVQGSSTEIALPCLSEGAVYTAAGERDWGTRYLDVDISEQFVRFYDENGEIIWSSECITGTPGGSRETVQGVWYVTDKESPYELVGYSGNVAQYETRVTYWMPFEGNSIGFHDATWQPDFGGDMYMEGYGSHGCVNLPYSKAQQLYSLIKIRDVVSVHE